MRYHRRKSPQTPYNHLRLHPRKMLEDDPGMNGMNIENLLWEVAHRLLLLRELHYRSRVSHSTERLFEMRKCR